MHWETKNLRDTLYCDIGFIAVVWNQTCDVAMYACIAKWPSKKEACALYQC